MKVYNKRNSGIPKEAIYIGRPTIWGNPFSKGSKDKNISDFREYAEKRSQEQPGWLKPLKGKDVVCWCSPAGCHGDVIIEIANRENEIDWNEWTKQNEPVSLDRPSMWELQNLL